MPRSTRNKLRHQAERAAAMIDRSMEHIAKLDLLADGESPYINEQVPALVIILENVKKLLTAFRDRL